MKLKEIHRTSTFAWAPLSDPLLATGTVAGALDESFSNESQLEIWEPNYMDKQEFELGGEGQPGPKGSITTSARFNRIAWGLADGSRPQGVLAAGMENGELGIWDPARIVVHADPAESLIFKNSTHTGPIRGLDFNPVQSNLFASGGVNGEIYIWNMTDPSKPYSPGTRSAKLDEISSLAWNNQVAHILASASGSGYTVVWDLRHKREVVALTYGAGAGPVVGGLQGGGMSFGARRGMSDVAWHPENATRLVTSSEDDASPVIMVWDLRNARAPEKILTGHEKGVLSLSWCKQDPDLLLSSGKDNRALCWNPQTSEIIGELPSANNWAFQVQWCPRNPDLLATAFFDGTIGIHSIQSPADPQSAPAPIAAPRADGADVFDNPDFTRTTQATFSLKQPPKWLRRPVSASFGYGGQLVSVSNLPSAQGTHQSGAVHLRKVVTEEDVVERATTLREADDSNSLAALAEARVVEAESLGEEVAGWRALASLFSANSRDELITLLGFSKADIALKIAEAVEKITASAVESAPVAEDNDSTPPKSPVEPDNEDELKPHEPVVSFAEPEEDAAGVAEQTPSEVSAGGASDATGATPTFDGESTTTAPPSLFGDENAAGTPHLDAAADFFTTMGLAPSASSRDPVVPHTNYGLDSSVAATIGSGPSSVASENIKSNTFRIYPSDESETDRLVTKALVVGDFDSAVALCLSSDRFADAILLAARGGPELLARTQKAYFERRTASLPYLRLFQSVVTNDLTDIVQNADLNEWQEIFVVVCTFAAQDDFAGLAEQLGARLEFQSTLAKGSSSSSVDHDPAYFRKNALLTYLAAGRLERLVNIWTEELAEHEAALAAVGTSRYTAHARALQVFVEKATVFRAATSYVDPDLNLGQQSQPKQDAFRLAALYDRYFEYADFLATQGRVKDALFYLKLTPESYSGASGSRLDLASGRERLVQAAAPAPIASSSKVARAPVSNANTNANAYGAFTGYGASAQAQQVSYGSPAQQPAYGLPNQQAFGVPPAGPPAGQYNTAPPAAAVAPPPAGAYGRPSPVSQPYGAPQNVNQAYATPQAPNQQYGGPQAGNHTYGPPQANSQPYGAQAPMKYPSPYGPGGDKHAPPSQAGLPPPPPPLTQTSFPPPPRPMSGPGSQMAPPPPPAASFKRDPGGWNDAPAVTERRGTPGAPTKPNAITSPFPASQGSPMMSPSYLSRGASPVPPPPRPGSTTGRNAAPVPPPPQAGQRAPPASFTPPQPAGGLQQDGAPPPPAMSPPRAGSFVPQQQRGHAPLGTSPYVSPKPAASTTAPVSSPYAPPPGQQNASRPGPPPTQSSIPPPGPPAAQAPAPAPRAAPPAPSGPKYPPGDRSHIPDSLRPIYGTITDILSQLRQNFPQQKRLLDDVEKRLNPLFDALNCETLPDSVVEKLHIMTQAMRNGDKQTALDVHVDMLTGTMGANISGWMSGMKQLIQRM